MRDCTFRSTKTHDWAPSFHLRIESCPRRQIDFVLPRCRSFQKISCDLEYHCSVPLRLELYRARSYYSQHWLLSWSAGLHSPLDCKTYWKELTEFLNKGKIKIQRGSLYKGLFSPVNRRSVPTTQLHNRRVLGCCKIKTAEVTILDVVNQVSMDGICRSFSFQLFQNKYEIN